MLSRSSWLRVKPSVMICALVLVTGGSVTGGVGGEFWDWSWDSGAVEVGFESDIEDYVEY